MTQQKDDELLKFYRQHNEIIRVSKIFGNWDYEIDVEVGSMKDLHTFCVLLRTHFGDIVEHLEVYPILSHHIYSTLPRSFFLENK